jgi:hypothetical protein
MAVQSAYNFRWLSALGGSVALFLGYALLNVLVGVTIPFVTRRFGTGGWPQPAVDLMSGLWLAIGILLLGVTWLGLRQGQSWGLWVAAAAGVAQLAGWVACARQTGDWFAPLFLYDAITLLPAILLGWQGLR